MDALVVKVKANPDLFSACHILSSALTWSLVPECFKCGFCFTQWSGSFLKLTLTHSFIWVSQTMMTLPTNLLLSLTLKLRQFPNLSLSLSALTAFALRVGISRHPESITQCLSAKDIISQSISNLPSKQAKQLLVAANTIMQGNVASVQG